MTYREACRNMLRGCWLASRSLAAGRPVALYVGCLDPPNLGDLAVLGTISDLLAPDLLLAPATGVERLGCLSQFPPSWLSPRAIVLGGGTLIKKDRSLYLGRAEALLAAFPHAMFIVFGSGVADDALWEQFGYWTDREAWVRLLESSDLLFVRGRVSRDRLRTWGLRQPVGVWLAQNAVRPKGVGNRIGVNLGPSSGKIYGGDESGLLRFGAQLLCNLASAGWRITLIPTNVDDWRFLRRCAEMSEVPGVRLHAAYLDVKATLAELKQQHVMIGQKLHSVILAHCVYTPSVMIAYRTKCLEYMDSVGQLDCVCRTDALSIEAVLDIVGRLRADMRCRQLQLWRALSVWKAELRKAADLVTAATLRPGGRQRPARLARSGGESGKHFAAR